MISENCIIKHDNDYFVICKRICEQIGLSRGQFTNQSKSIQKDPLLSKYILKQQIMTVGGTQTMICLNIKCLNIWLSKINFKTLNINQYKNIVDIINYTLNSDFESYKCESKSFDFESEMRDELFNIGYFNNIKIINKEVTYDFGRIDLLGTDINGNMICIELKKYKEFDDTKLQLLKYKESKVFDRVVFCTYIISDDFKMWCKINGIETYIYKREVKVYEV